MPLTLPTVLALFCSTITLKKKKFKKKKGEGHKA